MKQCFKCQRTLDASEFYAHPRMRDGTLNKCKDCTKVDVKKWYQQTHDERSLYERRRQKCAKRRAKKLEYMKAHRQKHRDRALARSAVSNAIRDGKLVRPSCCSACGCAGSIQAHHHDYSKPLDVVWLCFKCHRTIGHGQRTAA